MGKGILTIVIIAFGIAAIRSGSLLNSHDFSQTIADCKAMKDVTFIVEGRFKKPKKMLKLMALGDINVAKRDGVEPPPKPIYALRADIVHLGSTGVTNNRTGKQVVRSTYYRIRDGEAPEGLKGKGVICYKGSKSTRTIKSVHYKHELM